MATPDRNTYADVWEQLDGKYAERVRVTDAALLGDEEIVRRWPQIGEGYLSRCMTALSLFTDAKNNRAQKWVQDPVVGREVFPGVYRMVTVDVDTQKPGLKGIIQTLRKGFATSAVWTEARLAELEQGPANDVAVADVSAASDNPTRMLKVEFPNCAPESARAIVESLNSTTHSSPVIRGETYSGTWRTVWAVTKIEDDGSATVTLFLALAQYNLTSYADFATERQQDVIYLYDVSKPMAQTIIDAWKTKNPVGSSATTNYSRSNGLVDIILRTRTGDAVEADFGNVGEDCRYIETQVAIYGTDDETAYPIDSAEVGDGVSFTRTVRSNGDGTFDVILTQKTVKYRNVANLIVEQSGESETIQRQQLGVTDENVADMDEEDGVVKTQRVEVRDDCSKDVVTNVEEGKEQVTTERTVAKSYTEDVVDKTYQDNEKAPPTQEPSKIKTVRNTPSKYPGRWNVLERIRTLIHDATAVIYDVADDDSAHAQATEDINVPNEDGETVVELEAAAGTAVSATVQYNKESDTLDVRKVVEEGKEMVSGSTMESGAASETVEEKTFQDVELDPAEEVDGAIVKVENRKSKFTGKYDTRVTTEEGKQQTEIETTKAAGYTEVVERKTVQVVDLPAPTQTDGHIKSVRNADSKYPGRYDTVETDREVKALSATATGGGALFTESEVVTKNADADLSGQAAGAAGTIISTASTKNDAGKFDNRKTTRVAVEAGPVDVADGSVLVTEAEQIYRNSTVKSPGAGAAGTINQASNSINESGKIDSVVRVKTAVPFDSTLLTVGGDAIKTEQERILLNQSTVSVAAESGKSVSARVNVNEFGRLDARVSVATPTTAFDSEWVEYTDRYGKSYIRIFQNQASIPVDGFTDATSNSVSARRNEFGKYDGTASRNAIRHTSEGGSPDDDVEVSYEINIDGTVYSISEKITSSLTRAETHIAGTNIGGSGKTPGIVYIGKGKYKATKVTWV